MQLTRNRITVAIGAIVLVVLAFWGYQFSRSVGNLGEMLGGTVAPGAAAGSDSSASGSSPPEALQNPQSAPAIILPSTDDALDADAAERADLRQEVLEVRRDVGRVLVNDPELFASLDELFDETDEELLRENLTILREAFLSDSAAIPDID